MKVIAVNGSPRKTWNTAQMLESALRGAESVGAETKLYHLADMDFKGCISCCIDVPVGPELFGPELMPKVREHLTKLIPLYEYFSRF